MSPTNTTDPNDEDVSDRFRVNLEGKTLLGTYVIERQLAEGGMGAIYLARDTNLDRRVVVKVPHPRFLAERGFRTRLAREVSELVRLEHPHIVRILARGEHEEIPFFVLQYLGGGSLEDVLAAGGRQETAQVAAWLPAVAQTLDFVHRRGILHRDVKPANILFDGEGHVFLSDFGVAKALDADDEDGGLTGTGVGIGSPKYMAPEQGIGRDVTPSADQYGLASTVYEALTGSLPFDDGTPVEVLVCKSREEARDIREQRPELAEGPASAVMKALARDPSARHATCVEFARAFLVGVDAAPTFLAVTSVTQVPDRATPSDPTPRGASHEDAGPRTRPRWRVLAGIAAAFVLAVALFAFYGGSDPRGDTRSKAAGVLPDAPKETPGGGTAPPRSAVGGVVLLDAGQEPRQELRYAVMTGSTERLILEMEGGHTFEVGDAPPMTISLPPWALEADVHVETVAEEGPIRFRWVVTAVRYEEGGSSKDRFGKELAEGMVGVAAVGTTNAQGVTQEIVFEGTEGIQPFAVQMLESLRLGVTEFVTPLPAEPVGIGARWEYTRVVTMMGMRVVQSATYELLTLEGYRLGIRSHFVLAASPQEIQVEGAPTADTLKVTRFDGKGEENIRLNLSQLVPRGFDTVTRAEYAREATTGDETIETSGSFESRIQMGRR